MPLTFFATLPAFLKKVKYTYVVYRVDKRVVAGVAHGQPVKAEENHIYVSVPVNKLRVSISDV